MSTPTTPRELVPVSPEFRNGQALNRALTPGGHIGETGQYAFPSFHRKLADPSAGAWIAMGACWMMNGLIYVDAKGLDLRFQPAVLSCVVFLGFCVLTFATIGEFMTGRTYPATLFGCYAGYFGSVAVLNIPWFGVTGSYDGTKPNLYALGGKGYAEVNTMMGLWMSTFLILTFFFVVGATRQSATVLATLSSVLMYFILGMVYHLQNAQHDSLAKAAGAFSILAGACSWYSGLAAVLTPDTAFFTLPTFEFSVEKAE